MKTILLLSFFFSCCFGSILYSEKVPIHSFSRDSTANPNSIKTWKTIEKGLPHYAPHPFWIKVKIPKEYSTTTTCFNLGKSPLQQQVFLQTSQEIEPIDHWTPADFCFTNLERHNATLCHKFPAEESSLLIRTQLARTTPHAINLFPQEKLEDYIFSDILWILFYFSFQFMLIFWNLSFYLYRRIPVILDYLIFQIFFLLVAINYSGFGPLFGEWAGNYGQNFQSLFNALAFLFLSRFSLKHFELTKSRTIRVQFIRLLPFPYFLSGIAQLIPVEGFYYVGATDVGFVFASNLLFAISFWQVNKERVKQYLLPWGFLVLGILLLAFAEKLGMPPLITLLSPTIGHLLFSVAFSFGMSRLVYIEVQNELKKQEEVKSFQLKLVEEVGTGLFVPIQNLKNFYQKMIHSYPDEQKLHHDFLLSWLKLDKTIKNLHWLTPKSQNPFGLHFTNVHINSEIRQQIQLLKELYPEVDFHFNPDHDYWIEAPILNLKGVLFNLLENGCKFGEGSVEVALSRIEKDCIIQIEIKDLGPGIPREKVDDLFHSFTQSNIDLTREQDGLGIGLPVTSLLLRTLGGKIFLKDSKIGCHFLIELPYKTNIDQLFENEKPSLRKSILHVAPVFSTRKSFRAICQNLSDQFYSCKNFEEGISKTQELKQSLHYIFIDHLIIDHATKEQMKVITNWLDSLRNVSVFLLVAPSLLERYSIKDLNVNGKLSKEINTQEMALFLKK